MEWLKKTIENIKQIVWIIPAITDVRCIISLCFGIFFSVLAYKSSEINHRIIWSTFAALANGIFITYVLEYFGHYPLKEKLIENIKTLYSINDFLIKKRNEVDDLITKQLYSSKINEINIAIQRWSDKIKFADIEKMKNEVRRIENSHNANREIFEIDITKFKEFGISNEVIADFSGTTTQVINNIINTYGSLTNKK